MIRVKLVPQGSCGETNVSQERFSHIVQDKLERLKELKLSGDFFLRVPMDIIEVLIKCIQEGNPDTMSRSKSSLEPLLWEIMDKILHSYFLEQKLMLEASEYYEDVALELEWSPERLKNRLSLVFDEIRNTGQYTHTPEELELGCKLAWRNSAKCIGR